MSTSVSAPGGSSPSSLSASEELASGKVPASGNIPRRTGLQGSAPLAALAALRHERGNGREISVQRRASLPTVRRGPEMTLPLRPASAGTVPVTLPPPELGPQSSNPLRASLPVRPGMASRSLPPGQLEEKALPAKDAIVDLIPRYAPYGSAVMEVTSGAEAIVAALGSGSAALAEGITWTASGIFGMADAFARHDGRQLSGAVLNTGAGVLQTMSSKLSGWAQTGTGYGASAAWGGAALMTIGDAAYRHFYTGEGSTVGNVMLGTSGLFNLAASMSSAGSIYFAGTKAGAALGVTSGVTWKVGGYTQAAAIWADQRYAERHGPVASNGA
jgi:hypothetical protein